MKLLPNEEKLITSNEDKIILTNHRIQMTESLWGQSFIVSIFLENISSIEIKYKSNLLLLILGSIGIVGNLYMDKVDNGNFVGIFVGVLFLLVWWFTRKHIISISSDGGAKINFIVQGMEDEKINEFVHNVSLAKQTRVNQLAKI